MIVTNERPHQKNVFFGALPFFYHVSKIGKLSDFGTLDQDLENQELVPINAILDLLGSKDPGKFKFFACQRSWWSSQTGWRDLEEEPRWKHVHPMSLDL